MNLCDFEGRCKRCMGEWTLPGGHDCPSCVDSNGVPHPPAPENLPRIKATFANPRRYLIKEDYYDDGFAEDGSE